MNGSEREDPDATVWRAIATLETRGYTRQEIYDTLHKVALQFNRQKRYTRNA